MDMVKLKIQKTDRVKHRERSQRKAEVIRIGEQRKYVTLRIMQPFLL